MTAQVKSKEVWIGLLEVRPLDGCEILDEAKGAFVNVVMCASDADEYKSRAEWMSGELGVLIVGITRPEPVAVRRSREGDFEDAIEDMILRSVGHPNDVIYGTFHLYEKDDA